MTATERAQIKQLSLDLDFLLGTDGMPMSEATRGRLVTLADRLRELTSTTSARHLWFLGCGTDPHGSGLNKIGAVKAIRSLTHIGLVEAKNLVESAPQDLGPVDVNNSDVRELLRDHHVEWRDA